MEFILSTGSLYTYGTERSFHFAADAGFDGIELMVDERWDTRQPDHLHRLMDRYQLPIRTVHSPFFRVPGWPGDQPGLIEHSVNLAEQVGARVVVHHLPERTGYLQVRGGNIRLLLPVPFWDRHASYRNWLRNGYRALQERTDVALCIENMPAKTFLGRRWNPCTWNTHSWQTVDEITRFATLTMDTTHLGTWGLDPAEVYGRWRDRVQHVHLSNFDGREHRRPEAGQLRLDRLLARLAAGGYAGAVALELHPDALEAGADDARVVELLATSLRLCRSWAGQAKL
jgi:sugar phosphate isomerase/epimerase